MQTKILNIILIFSKTNKKIGKFKLVKQKIVKSKEIEIEENLRKL